MKEKMSRKRKVTIILLIVVAFLVVVRLALPFIVLHFANRTLANMKGYYGHINDIDIALLRGAYKMDSVYLNKVDSSGKQTPFIAAKLVDLSVEWKALLHGSFVGEVIFQDAMMRFTKDKVEPKQVRKDSSQLNNVGDKFMPLDINRFEIRNGRIEYVDQFSKPKVDVKMSDVYLTALNLRNSYDSSALLPATVTARASVYEGTVNFNMKMNPLAKDPTFDLNAEVKNTNLVKLNDFFKAYAKVDVNKGRFGLYTEVAAKEGAFTGYVKPLIKDLDVLGKEDRKDNIFQKMWEGIVGTVGKVFQNQRKDQLATKIPFRGSLKNPKTDGWYAIGQILENAFISAIQPSIDNQINIASVNPEDKNKKPFFEKALSKKDEKKNKREERRKERKEKREAKRKKKSDKGKENHQAVNY